MPDIASQTLQVLLWSRRSDGHRHHWWFWCGYLEHVYKPSFLESVWNMYMAPCCISKFRPCRIGIKPHVGLYHWVHVCPELYNFLPIPSWRRTSSSPCLLRKDGQGSCRFFPSVHRESVLSVHYTHTQPKSETHGWDRIGKGVRLKWSFPGSLIPCPPVPREPPSLKCDSWKMYCSLFLKSKLKIKQII